jgi:hypothetical protein
MHASAFRRFAGEIIPVTVFSCAILLFLALTRFALVPQAAALGATALQLDYFKSLVSDRNRYQEIRIRLLDKQRLLADAVGRAAPAPADYAAGGLSDLLQLLISRAKEADIRFVKMLPQLETAHRDRAEYPVVLEMTTSYHSLGRFVASLEQTPQALRVERLAVTAQKNGLDVHILVTCFLKKAP